MAIRQNSALAATLFAAAALACSERTQPAAPALWLDAVSPATQATSHSGRATVVQASVLGLAPITLVDAGPLPPSGGAEEASLLNASIPGLLTAEVLHATTVGQGNASRSEASVAELTLTAGGNTISAGFLEARAVAQCTDNGAAASGSSDIARLTVNGQTIAVSGAPNQTVNLPGGGQVIINEQNSAGSGDITVNALHVIVPGVADVIISSAHADISCQPAPPPTPPPGCSGDDFVTGGGWITSTPSGARANFGVGGGIKQGAFWGHLTYIDHGPDGVKVKGTGVSAYTVVNATTRHIEGTAEVNGQSGFTYTVDVADNGEPGSNDTFVIRLSDGYTSSPPGTLAGGNIQLHAPACK
ncbi:MAG TPA: choice-of-anchor P family protein [Gemmatimonadales bacterium]|nr:choice-of-anchor P family protein [Gemmatimonadales bacterium]